MAFDAGYITAGIFYDDVFYQHWLYGQLAYAERRRTQRFEAGSCLRRAYRSAEPCWYRTGLGFNLGPLIGMATGSIPMVGGHGTAGSFGPLLEQMGAQGAATVAIAAATFGLVMGSVYRRADRPLSDR